MPVSNSDIATLFERYATLLEIQGANPYRVRAYQNAARSIKSQGHEIRELVGAGTRLEELPDIGTDLAAKIRELVTTGEFAALAELAREVPDSLADLVALPGLGPKRVRALWTRLGVENFDELRAAAASGRVRAMPGFGARTERALLEAIDQERARPRRIRLVSAEEQAKPLLSYLGAIPGVKQVAIAGSYRRRQETVGDLDLLLTCRRGTPAIEQFTGYEDVRQVLAKGSARSSVVLRSGLQVDLRVVTQASFGSALLYFTGSKAHNLALRRSAQKRGLKLNEYGLYRGSRRVAGNSEREVYEYLGLSFIEPELREDHGEIEAARTAKLPRLIANADVRGDLHAHTLASDGRNSLREMAAAARELGYDYLAITDHSRNTRVANGLDPKRLAAQIEEIDRLNEELVDFRVLKSSEVDILEDGTLDLPDSILRELDLTVCSVHDHFGLPREAQTGRIIRAMDNPYFNILGHPTGRLIGSRPPYPVDVERVMEAAMKRGCYLEVNAQPTRLDLNDLNCRLAHDLGLKLSISTDAHSAAGLGNLHYGLDQARRGWLGPDDILNTRSWQALKKLLLRS